MAKFKYVEPVSYFPKEIRDKVFGETEKKQGSRRKKPAAKKKTEPGAKGGSTPADK